MKIALLSNINIDIVASLIADGIDIYSPPGYDTWYQDVLNTNSGLYAFRPDIIAMMIDGNAIIDNLTDPKKKSEAVEAEIAKIRETAARFIDSYFIIATMDLKARAILPLSMLRDESRLENDWYVGLSKIAAMHGHFCVFDIKKLIEDIGRQKFYDEKMWYMGSIPYGLVGSRALADTISHFASVYSAKRKKCLVVDLDNTLWGGVIGEDGVDGIVLGDTKEGARFRDIQRRLLEIKDTGILLAIASKNNENDALNAIRNHPAMVLSEKDFVQIRANWSSKSDNIIALAQELNIGIGSIVFLDDNPAEREEVKARLPQVAVIEPFHHNEIYEDDLIKANYDYFSTISITEEDHEKTELYISEQRRQGLRLSTSSLDEYLIGLGIKVDLRQAERRDLDRVAQLTQKTNQFNLTGKRYTIADILNIYNDPSWRIYIASASDKFGSNGIILVTILRIEKDEAEIDTFLMSCRVMGRGIENAVLSTIEKKLLQAGINTIVGRYVRTANNSSIEHFFDSAGYRIISDSSEIKSYRKEPILPVPIPNFIAME